MFDLLSIHENVLLVDYTSKFGVESKCSVDLMPKFANIFFIRDAINVFCNTVIFMYK